MAIDTKAKRAAIFGVAQPWLQFVEPDASKGPLWRASICGVYGGNPFGQLVEPWELIQTSKITQRHYVVREGAETLTKMSSVATGQLDLTLSFHDVLPTSDVLLDAGSDITPVDSGFLSVANVAVNTAVVNGVPIGRALQFRVSTIAEFNGDQKFNVRIVTSLGTKLDWEYTVPVSSYLDGGSLTTLSSPDGQFDLAVDLASYLENDSSEILAGGTTVVPDDVIILEILSQQVNTEPIVKGGITIPIGLGYQFRVRSKVLNTSVQLLNLKIVGTDGTKLDLQFKESIAPKLKAV